MATEAKKTVTKRATMVRECMIASGEEISFASTFIIFRQDTDFLIVEPN